MLPENLLPEKFVAKLTTLMVVTAGTAGLAAGAIVSCPSSPAHAGSFPGMNTIIQDLMPCDAIRDSNRQPGSCIILRERVNLFQGFGKTKSAQQYCQEKYGKDTSVVWKIGLRWCATPTRYGA
jgi:hypothetical protein